MPQAPEPKRRLFFALWPDAAVRESLASVSKKHLRRVKRVSPDNLHLTLAFPGSVTQAVQQCLETGAGGVVAPAFELLIDRAGHWPRPRISWIGPTRIPPGLWSLVTALRQVLGTCGLEPEARAYQPHITLARKTNPGAVAGEFTPIHWSIRNFCLVESVTDPAGAKYFPLRSWELEG
ncbi:MAG: RNA 2',3'-cyclic phosphodiesterase [Thiohalobacterales bacterium]